MCCSDHCFNVSLHQGPGSWHSLHIFFSQMEKIALHIFELWLWVSWIYFIKFWSLWRYVLKGDCTQLRVKRRKGGWGWGAGRGQLFPFQEMKRRNTLSVTNRKNWIAYFWVVASGSWLYCIKFWCLWDMGHEGIALS